MRSLRSQLVLGGLTAALFVGMAGMADFLTPDADAASKRRRRGRNRGALRLASISLAGRGGVALNSIIEFQFTSRVKGSSVDPSIFQIRAENADGTGYTRQVPGDFQHQGNLVRFFPRLPSHLRDPDDPRGGFLPVGSEGDNANDNSGLQPDTNYEIRVIGNPSPSAVRSQRNRPLTRSYSTRFTTAPSTDRERLYSTASYSDTPPPQMRYSNPADRVADEGDQFTFTGGTRDVPSDLSIALFGNRVPLSPTTVRREGNVTLTMLSRGGDTGVRQIVEGTPFLEQSFETTRLVFEPRFPLPDRGVFALRLTKDVADLTEQFGLVANPERARLREIYDFLSSARAQLVANGRLDPDPSELPDPPLELIPRWPQGATNATARAVLKGNLLALGDASPEEVDPRVMLVFSTRDEPVSEGELVFEFERSDGLLDPRLTIADWDGSIPGVVAAVATLGGGNGTDGDFEPDGDTVISSGDFQDGVANWRRMRIPQGVRVRVTGDRPLQMNALDLILEGEITADGEAGEDADTGTFRRGVTNVQPQNRGGAGGPGGGAGGSSSTEFFVGNRIVAGGPGLRGVNAGTTKLQDDDAGFPGQGGTMEVGTNMRFGAGGGGGGARTAGTNGADSTANTNIVGWSNGKGGQGGAGSANEDLQPLSGGAGGGAGGNATRLQGLNWSKTAAGGGGGGGALQIQTSGVFVMGAEARIRARGGRGGNGTNANGTLSAGPGGGGGGGSVLLRSIRGFNIADPGAAIDVSGGGGGTQTGGSVAPSGGRGGTGYARLESPNGGLALPGGTAGTFSPVGGGAPSIAYTKWTDLGVLDPRLVNPTAADFGINPGPNDAVLIEVQFAKDDPANPGFPLVRALDADENSTDPDELSTWIPLRVVDKTGITGGAFGSIAGYDSRRDGLDHTFSFADQVNDRAFGHVRIRVTFQLDESHSVSDSLPFVDRVVLKYQFNL